MRIIDSVPPRTGSSRAQSGEARRPAPQKKRAKTRHQRALV